MDRIIVLLDVSVPVQEEIAKLKAMLDDADIETILDGGLHEFIDTFQFNLNVVDDALYRSFFDLAEGQLVSHQEQTMG